MLELKRIIYRQILIYVFKTLCYFFLLLLSICAAPAAALFGPVITGAATESLARASLSFTTNNILQGLNKNNFENKNNYQLVLHK